VRDLEIRDALRHLCTPLSDEEAARLEANVLADGCRDALAVWEPEGEGGPQVLLDGHNRYGLCQRHGLAYRTVVIPLESFEAAVNWIIDNQLGRRNATPEQKSYLRGKRYNLEKRADEGHGDQRSDGHNAHPNKAEELAREYGVDEKTIRRDAEFAEAVDTLEEEVRQDLRQTVLKRKSRTDQTRTTKKQVVRAAKAVKERRVEPLPFMRRAERSGRTIR
jgi:hypothetical protein